jgi:hypothetical protein
LTQWVEDDITTWRNTTLVLLPLGASIILSLSPSALKYLSEEYAFRALLFWLAGGLTAFILFHISKKRIHDCILEMETSFFSGKGKIAFFRGHTLSQTDKLDKIVERKIEFYYQFTNVVAGAVALEVKSKLEKMLRHRSLLGRKPFQKIKKELDDGIQAMTHEVDTGKQVYRTSNTVWARSNADDMAAFGTIFKDFIEYSLNQNKASGDKERKKNG